MAATELARLSATADPAPLLAALRRDGAAIVEGLVGPATIDGIVGDVAADLAVADPDMTHLNPALQFFFAGTRNVTGLAGRSRTFATEVMMHPLLIAACDEFLAPACARYQLNLGHLIERLPGAGDQFLHRDEDVWNLVPHPRPELQIASVWAFTDFTRDNGATRVVPGSHRWERGRQPEAGEIAVAEMPAGSAVIYLGSTLHGGGANTSQQPRRGVHLSYTLGWLRTEENNYLAVPPDIARTLPRECQELVGYAVHDAIAMGGGYLGMIDMRNPVDVFAEEHADAVG